MKPQIFLLLCSIFTATLTAQPNAEANIRAAYAALERRDFATFTSLCADDFTELGLAAQPVRGAAAAIEQYKMFLTAFPDLKFGIEQITPAGNGRYYLKVTLTGTNTAPMMMFPPSGKSIRYTDIDIVELNAAGKCTSHWSANPNEALRQIGLNALTNPATGLVFAAYDAFGKGDVPTLLNLCTDGARFSIHDRSFDSKARIFSGKSEVGAFFGELASKFKYSKFQPVRFYADGDDVMVQVEVEFQHLASGKTFAANYAHHFHIENGKISWFKGMDDFPLAK